MSTLRVDNIQKEDGSAVITDGVIPSTILRGSNVGMVKLNTTDITSSTATIVYNSTLITDDYDKYMISYQGLNPVSNGVKFRSRYSTDNGVSFETGTFNYGYHYARLGSSSEAGGGTTKTDYAESEFTSHSTIADMQSGMFSIDGLRDATLNLHIRHEFVQRSGSGGTYYNVAQEGWQYPKSVVMNYIEFSFDSGNFADGTFTLYGLVK